jgi:3-methyladenine DNA glycosylase AlkD
MSFTTVGEVLGELEKHGDKATRAVLLKHGAKEPCFGVKIDAIKSILKKTVATHDLAVELFRSNVFDAMYMAGLVMDGSTMPKAELKEWANTGYGSSISSYTVPWVASENPHGYELALTWISSKDEFIAVTGWETLGAIASIRQDRDLDIATYRSLLESIPRNISTAKNRVKQSMNGFVITIGIYIAELNELALQVADKLGKVKVDVGDTACKIPEAREYIEKAKSKGKIGQKKMTVKC